MKRYPKPTKMLGKNLGQRGNNLNPKHLGRKLDLHDEAYLGVECRHCIPPQQPQEVVPVENVSIRYVMFPIKCNTAIVAYVVSFVAVPFKRGYPFMVRIFAGCPTRNHCCSGPQNTVNVIFVQLVEGL